MSLLRRIRIRMAEDDLASRADDLRNHDRFEWAHSHEYNAIKRPRLNRRVEKAEAKLRRLGCVHFKEAGR